MGEVVGGSSRESPRSTPSELVPSGKLGLMGLLGRNDCLCSMLYYDLAGPKDFYDGAEANTQVSGPGG